MNYLRRRCTWNIPISPLTKITKLIAASYLLLFISACWERKEKSGKRWFWLACEHRRILVGYLKLFRFMSVMMVIEDKMQIEQHWVIPQTVPYSVQRNWKQQVLRRNNRMWKMAKWDFALIMTLERKWKTQNLKTDYARKRSTEF